jgi:hypothetical protein
MFKFYEPGLSGIISDIKYLYAIVHHYLWIYFILQILSYNFP